MNEYQEKIIVICNKMNRRNSEMNSQYMYDQNCANYVPIDHQSSQRAFKKISASNSKRTYNPETVLSNYQTYFVPVPEYNSNATKLKEQRVHTHYSYSSNSLTPPYVQVQKNIKDGRNNIVYLKYPDENVQLKDSNYYSQSNYLEKEQENLLEYGVNQPPQNYSYYVPDDKIIYKNPQQPKMVYSSYVPDVDVKFAKRSHFYYPYSSEPSISSQRSIDDVMEYSVNKSNYKEEPEKMSASKPQPKELSKKNPNMIKRIPKSNVSNKMMVELDDIYGTPCDETPTKQHSAINANTQTSNHNLRKKSSVFKAYACTQTEHENICCNRSKETQTLNYIGGNLFGGFFNKLAQKGYLIYSFYLRTTVIRWLRRILIELAWSVYNCPSNCPMQDRIIFSYLNHIENKSPLDPQECKKNSNSRTPSRQNGSKQRKK